MLSLDEARLIVRKLKGMPVFRVRIAWTGNAYYGRTRVVRCDSQVSAESFTFHSASEAAEVFPDAF